MVCVINDSDAITAEWLTRTLRKDGCLSRGHVASVYVASETSYTSTIAWLTLTYSDDAPPTVPTRLLLKLSRLDSEQSVVGSQQRQREVEFHSKVASAMVNPSLAHCYHAAYDEESGASHLLFDDVSDTHFQGKPSLPPPRPQCVSIMDAFAQFHAFWWDNPMLGDVDSLPNQESVAEHIANTRKHFSRFADTLGNLISDSQRGIYERSLASLPRLWERVTRRKHLTLIHGDANLSNVLLPHEPDRDSAIIIDWQLWGISFATEDLAHLVALFWDREHRMSMEKDLLMRYHQGLIRHGVENYEWADCWHDYRLAVILRVLFMPMWFCLSGSSVSWWTRSLERAMQSFADLECLELLDDWE